MYHAMAVFLCIRSYSSYVQAQNPGFGTLEGINFAYAQFSDEKDSVILNSGRKGNKFSPAPTF